MEESINPHPIDVHCIGCQNAIIEPSIAPGSRCKSYWYPETKWMNGRHCPCATHIEKKKEEVKKVDPIKASKAKMKGRI